jgi:hypothetical protein
MRITQLIDTLRQAGPINFLCGAGCSQLPNCITTFPGDPTIRAAVKKYDSDPLLSQIKRNYFHRTQGLEDVHSCLLALTDGERQQILGRRTTWANVCIAELLRTGKAARVLSTNFDGNLVRATATMRMLPPLYRREHPPLRDSAVPSIYLLGEAAPETIGRLIEEGADTGPWIVIGCSGKRFGLSEALLGVPHFAQGLYWVGYFHEEPPAELRDGLFTPGRNAHWIAGFDADSFAVYLLRGLGTFPPEGAPPETFLGKFEKQRPEPADLRPIMPDIERLYRAPSAEVRALLDRVFDQEELADRAGLHWGSGGILAGLFAKQRAPREVKPYLVRASDLAEPNASEDVTARFAEICRQLAQYSHGDEAERWYARGESVFPLMDFGPGCGAPMLYGHLSSWMSHLGEWACFEPRANSAPLFARAREKFLEDIAYCEEPSKYPQRAAMVARRVQQIVPEFVALCYRRARMLPESEAIELLGEARRLLERFPFHTPRDIEFRARQLMREAEASPSDEASLLAEAEAQFRALITMAGDQAPLVLINWASSLGEIAMARTGEAAARLYRWAGEKFEEAEPLQPDAVVLHKNWSSILVRQAHDLRLPATVWQRARHHAERANALEPANGSYNLACVAASEEDREGIARWLADTAEYGKTPPLSHILSDVNFAALRSEPWFLRILDDIFDAGLSVA